MVAFFGTIIGVSVVFKQQVDICSIWVYNTFMKSKIFITQRDNDKYFKQKMPTWRNGFCEIVRNVTIEKDPHNIYLDGEWGYITVHGRKIYVTRAGTEFAFEIRG